VLVYDAENRVVSATNGGCSGSYTRDGNGLRVEKVCGSTTTVYIFSGSKVIAEYDNGAVPTSPSREYIYSGGALLAKIASGTSTYYHQDQLSNRLVTDSNGNSLEQLGTYPFGESWYNTGNEKWLFTTYERDAESLNDYAMARSYVNRLARFSAMDPLGGDTSDPQSLNAYPYVENDPANLVDPTGAIMLVPTGCTAVYPVPGQGAQLVCAADGWTDTGVVTGLPLLYMGGHGGTKKDVNKTWSEKFPCNKSAGQVMSAVQNDMGRFADNRDTVFAANFPDQPIQLGNQYVIQPGFNPHTSDGYELPTGTLVVTVTSQSAYGWTFTTDPSQHYFDGTVSFSSADSGNGNVTFSVTANANWVSPFTHYTIGPVILAGENSTWNNMLKNVQGYCNSPVRK
jgi:RHS repeat-associated protein